MRKLVIFIFLTCSYQTNAQKLKCSDLRKGTFTIKATNSDLFITVERDSLSQVERVITDNEILEAYETITWLNKCSYRIRYDESKMELDDTQKLINALNGIVVRHISFTHKCSRYQAILRRPDRKELIEIAEFCKTN